MEEMNCELDDTVEFEVLTTWNGLLMPLGQSRLRNLLAFVIWHIYSAVVDSHISSTIYYLLGSLIVLFFIFHSGDRIERFVPCAEKSFWRTQNFCCICFGAAVQVVHLFHLVFNYNFLVYMWKWWNFTNMAVIPLL